MTVYEVVGKVEGTQQGMLQCPGASNYREPLLPLSLRSRELLLEHTHREVDGEGYPRGSLSVYKGMLSTCNYLATDEANRVNTPTLLVFQLLKATVPGAINAISACPSPGQAPRP